MVLKIIAYVVNNQCNNLMVVAFSPLHTIAIHVAYVHTYIHLIHVLALKYIIYYIL